MLKRRDFLHHLSVSGSALLLGVTGPSARAQSVLKVQSLAADTVLVTGGACNVLVQRAGSGELLVVDGGLQQDAGPLLSTIRSALGDGKISTLINTHWHPEQTGLNTLIGNRETRIFAHANTQQWLGTTIKRLLEDTVYEPLPESARPNEIFHHYGDFRHGDSTVEYGLLRQAHTDGDMYVFLPEQNVLHAGGVLCTDGWPFLDWWCGGWIGGIADGLETLLGLADDRTVIIPASGPPIDRTQLQEFHDIYAELFDSVRTLFVKANTVEQTVAARPAARWEARFGPADAFITQAHWSLIPHLTPDA